MKVVRIVVALLVLLAARPALAEGVVTTGAASQEGALQGVSSQVATPSEPTPIFDAQDLLAMAANPSGSYVLMDDVDLTGVAWQPIEFRGTLDGGGHAILNAQVTTTTSTTRTTYDGNMKEYDTVFAGFFGTLENATVRNVVFLGLDVDVTTPQPSFAGGVCGYMDDSVIEGCTVGGQVSLATSGASFGVGGIVGFGRGRIANTVADVTLVCRDQDAASKDEQFMGGAYANGYADLEGNAITLRGYDSDHGYVHDGGLVGMYIVYPEGAEHSGTVANNRVSGFITFFEDNEDRRAYCEPEIGENMSQWAITTREGNTSDFTPDERFEYDTDLLPHTCDNPQWTEEVVAGNCFDRGHTQRTCTTCGYTYPYAWTPLVHEVGEWHATDVKGKTLEEGNCTRCGATVFREATAESAQASSQTSADQAVDEGMVEGEAASQAQAESKGSWFSPLFVIVPAALVVVLIIALLARR